MEVDEVQQTSWNLASKGTAGSAIALPAADLVKTVCSCGEQKTVPWEMLGDYMS